MRSSRWRKTVPLIILELVVVFVGVYAAFALSEHQAERQASERRRQIQLALVREIEDITANTCNAAHVIGRMVASYDSALAAGGTPPLEPMMEAVGVENHMWDAALVSGGLDLLDVETIFRLSEFYNELNAGFAQMEQLRELTQTLLLPNLDAGTSEFYERPGRLRRRYGWYLVALRNLQVLATRTTIKGEVLMEALGQPTEEPCDLQP
jgi:hypothetical protein